MPVAFDLGYYGKTLATYTGQGWFQASDATRAPCQFLAGQLPNGSVMLICEHHPSQGGRIACQPAEPFFEGITDDSQWRVVVPVQGLTSRFHIHAGQDGSTIRKLVHVSSLTAVSQIPCPVKRVRYGLTNLEFRGTEVAEHEFVLPLELHSRNDIAPLKVRILPIRDYKSVIDRVTLMNGIDVTCEAEFETPNELPQEDMERGVDALCYLLSITRGTKVQWIYCHRCDAEGRPVIREHYDRVTKPYSVGYIIHPGWEGRQATKSFIETGYPVFWARRNAYSLTNGLIDSYLDAKSEGNYIEIRSLELVAVMEMLKDVYLNSPDTTAKEFILDKATFRELQRTITDQVKRLGNYGVSEADIELICNNMSGLNRTSFKRILQSLLGWIDHHVEEPELNLFVRCRNSLVHRGNFYAASDAEQCLFYFDKVQVKDIQASTRRDASLAHYDFITSFVDRVFLKLFRYSGPYLDARVRSPDDENGFNRAEI